VPFIPRFSRLQKFSLATIIGLLAVVLKLGAAAKSYALLPERPDASPDVPLISEALAELRHRYGMLNLPGLQQVYADALERCKLDKRGRAATGGTDSSDCDGMESTVGDAVICVRRFQGGVSD
jgi:hypothetical protein